MGTERTNGKDGLSRVVGTEPPSQEEHSDLESWGFRTTLFLGVVGLGIYDIMTDTPGCLARVASRVYEGLGRIGKRALETNRPIGRLFTYNLDL